MNGFVSDFLKQGLGKLLESRKSPLVVLSSILLILIIYSFIFSKFYSTCWIIFNFLNLTENPWLNNVIKSLFVLLLLYFFFLVVFNIVRKIRLINKYELDWRNFDKDWDVQGICLFEKESDKKVLKVMNSEVGCILKNHRWNHYEFSFQFKIPKLDEIPEKWQSYETEEEKDGKKEKVSKKYEEDEVWKRGFGVIVQASSLDEYHMLKIDRSGYHPHVRAIIWRNLDPVVTLEKPDRNWKDSWISAKFTIKEGCVDVAINNNQKFSYVLPSMTDISIQGKDSPAKFLRINNRGGSVGFRCSPTEIVYIRDLIVINKEKLLTSMFKDLHKYAIDVLTVMKGEVGI